MEIVLVVFVVIIVLSAIITAVSINSFRKALLENDTLRVLLKNKKNLKNKDCANEWNDLWSLIRYRFNIYKMPDGMWHGGQHGKEIMKLMRAEFGTFNKEQILFMRQMILLLCKVKAAQREYEAKINPIDKDIIFDAEGGFSIVDKLKPSVN